MQQFKAGRALQTVHIAQKHFLLQGVIATSSTLIQLFELALPWQSDLSVLQNRYASFLETASQDLNRFDRNVV